MPATSIRSASPDSAGDIGAALALMDLVGGGGSALACGRRSSFSYRRIPDPPLRLTVRKLDGSFFGTLRINLAPSIFEISLYFPPKKFMMRSDVLPPPLTDVEIARSAAVWELKAAIEELFFALFDDTDKAISWYGTLPPSLSLP
jgi:U11/U12 small nuclear ribonucleoprotein 25 kDa protein